MKILRVFRRSFWSRVYEKLFRRKRAAEDHAVPETINQFVEDRLTDTMRSIKLTDAIKTQSIKVWCEGSVPCKEHHWHHVQTSSRHVMSMNSIWGRESEHKDTVCCRCTFGMCEIIVKKTDSKNAQTIT